MTHDRTGEDGRALKLTLVGTFLASIAVAGRQASGRKSARDPLDLVLMGLASYRIGRMVAFERVGEPLREHFTAEVPDESGVDDTVVARGRGPRWVIGELLSCPTCIATWAALGLSIGSAVLPGPIRMLTNVLAAAGVAEIANGGVEHLEWSARAARARAK
ncbi:MAG: DUF1360 domain-containing protein [Chloroflexota bacterium]|nr:DUF1360 domain-containing protein [Chloroflexota bacterium]